MLDVPSYMPLVNLGLTSILATWAMMDYNLIQHTTNSEQLRQESFISFLSICTNSILLLTTIFFSIEIQNIVLPILSFAIFVLFNKLQPQEFGFWSRNKVRAMILTSIASLGLLGIFLQIPAAYFPLISSFMIFNQHHASFKATSADNAKNLEALRKQAIFFQAEINNKTSLNDAFSQNKSNDIEQKDNWHIAG